MKRKRHNPEQIIRKLRSAEQLLNQQENSRLKRLLAEAELDKAMLKELVAA
jgi:hypothetical protein